MKALHMVAYTLLWIGGINWGLIGLFEFNLVEAIVGDSSVLTSAVYILVGASAVLTLITHKGHCVICGKKS